MIDLMNGMYRANSSTTIDVAEVNSPVTTKYTTVLPITLVIFSANVSEEYLGALGMDVGC